MQTTANISNFTQRKRSLADAVAESQSKVAPGSVSPFVMGDSMLKEYERPEKPIMLNSTVRHANSKYS